MTNRITIVRRDSIDPSIVVKQEAIPLDYGGFIVPVTEFRYRQHFTSFVDACRQIQMEAAIKDAINHPEWFWEGSMKAKESVI